MPKIKSENLPLPLPVSHLLEQWGKVIKAQRTYAQIHMRDFAYRIHVSLDTLQRLERGEPSIQIATYLNAMWALGLLDELCMPPPAEMLSTDRVRVLAKQKHNDYF